MYVTKPYFIAKQILISTSNELHYGPLLVFMLLFSEDYLCASCNAKEKWRSVREDVKELTEFDREFSKIRRIRKDDKEGMMIKR